jgi:hypothetical protein
MPLTRVSLATEVVGRAGGFLSAVGLPITADATNTTVMLAGRKALARVGIAPITAGAFVDADVAAVPAARVEEYYDWATLETLRIVLLSSTGVDQRVDNDEQKLSQLADSLRKAIALLMETIDDEYGTLNNQSVAVGRMTKGTPYPNDPKDAWKTATFPRWPYPEGA